MEREGEAAPTGSPAPAAVARLPQKRSRKEIMQKARSARACMSHSACPLPSAARQGAQAATSDDNGEGAHPREPEAKELEEVVWSARLRAARSSWRSRRAQFDDDEVVETEHQKAEPTTMFITGNRLCSMDSFTESILPRISCPQCNDVGTMVARAEDEKSYGLAGTVVLCCMACNEVTLTWEHGKQISKEVNSSSGHKRPGPAMKDLNLRAAIAVACSAE
ncbi:hypothetical protein AB1Y20_020471 [Prymnesium parvum]|uniref:DNL-type domain-containing protein n=1 Tax=Prymnesium parvum TaxID=97485 RepID=A0AB34JTI9_PRYPA